MSLGEVVLEPCPPLHPSGMLKSGVAGLGLDFEGQRKPRKGTGWPKVLGEVPVPLRPASRTWAGPVVLNAVVTVARSWADWLNRPQLGAA